MAMENNKISAVLITYNEEANIGRTLESLSWCDEIVVVDSGSSDNTVNLCESKGCRVMFHPFSGYGQQKRFAVSQARHDWILSIDADEVLTQDLQREIIKHFEHNDTDTAGYYLPRTLVFMGKQFRYGNERSQPCLRLFNRNYGEFSDDRVHEAVRLNGPTRLLKGAMLHYSYLNIDQYFEKFNRYTSMAASQLYERGKSANRVAIALRLPITFLQTYIPKGNFMNGYPGFVWSLFCGLYPVVKYLKLYELSSKLVIPSEYYHQRGED